MPGPVFLRGDRVTLRPPAEDDLDFLQRCHNDPDVRLSMPRVHPQSREDTREEYVEATDDATGLLICAGDDDDPDRLGFCALFRINEDSGRAEVGAWLAPEAEGHGYATDGVSTLVSYAFEERRLNRLNAGRLSTNERSGALLDRLGFAEEGCRREYCYVDGEYVDRMEYGLLAEEWESR